jgi:hypothetical protein
MAEDLAGVRNLTQMLTTTACPKVDSLVRRSAAYGSYPPRMAIRGASFMRDAEVFRVIFYN